MEWPQKAGEREFQILTLRVDFFSQTSRKYDTEKTRRVLDEVRRPVVYTQLHLNFGLISTCEWSDLVKVVLQ